MKRKHENFIFLTIVLCSAAVLGFRAGGLKAEPAHREAMAFSNALFIGDSLMEGAYWYYDDAGEKTFDFTVKTIPEFYRRMTGAEVTAAGYSGIGAETWYKEKSLPDYSAYDLVIIWLGTNDGYTAGQFENGVKPFDDFDAYSEDPTGYYCRIVASVKESNPKAHIVLCTVFDGGNFNGDSTLESTNETIKRISGYYGCQLCDMSWLRLEEGREYHAGIDNIHLGVYGNLCAAEYLYDEISQAVRDDYTIAEKMF